MNNSHYSFVKPVNEPVYSYAPGTPERKKLREALQACLNEQCDIPVVVGGKEIRTGNTSKVIIPHNHQKSLGVFHRATEQNVNDAIAAALKAKAEWAALPWTERASVMLKIAELISTKYRYKLAASVMLGQSKNPMQAEIDAPCELIDFLTFGAYYAGKIYEEQPLSPKGMLNRLEYRPLEGFVFAVTPFNFTSIASNLNLAPAMMGNTTLWKPSSTSIYSNYLLMQIFKEAGLPDGVVNFLPGKGSVVGDIVVPNEHFAGLHFTGSTSTFNHLWMAMSNNIDRYRGYPRIVGETGGKNFVMVHPSATSMEVSVALVRGAFEYQGQKCSAASRAYIPRSLWPEVKDQIAAMFDDIKMGDVLDFGNFVNAVIDEASFDNIMRYVDAAKSDPHAKVIFGGKGDKSVGYFIEPTVIEVDDPNYVTMREELFGPVLTLYVYDDKDFDKMLEICDGTGSYALTGSIFAQDRYAVERAMDKLRNAAGNFYINDKPTGAIVGQQPFGGARASGTNDKAGGPLNLMRWCSPRCIKETFVPPTDYKYPFLSSED